jgi:hypothetical protein
MAKIEITKTELVWPGKYKEDGTRKEVPRVSLPFQVIKTKGRVWEGTEAKDAAICDWCQRITEQTGQQWEFARVNQRTFQASKPRTLAEVVRPVDLEKAL